jgi:hypothetical protein
MEAQKEMKTGWERFWLIVGIGLFVAYFILLGVIVYFQWGQGQRHYLDGLNGTFEGYARNIYTFFVWLATLPVFTLTIVYACFLKSMFKSNPRIPHLKTVLLVLLILLNPIITFISMYKLINYIDNPSNYKRFTEGYRDWAKSILEVEQIRNWMKDLKDTNSFGIYEDFEGPKCLAENHSRFNAGFIFEEEGKRILRIMSGGGWQDWGIVIGPEDMEVPGSETIKDYDEYSGRYGEYHLKLAEGAYVYYELQ